MRKHPPTKVSITAIAILVAVRTQTNLVTIKFISERTGYTYQQVKDVTIGLVERKLLKQYRHGGQSDNPNARKQPDGFSITTRGKKIARSFSPKLVQALQEMGKVKIWRYGGKGAEG